MEGSPILVLLPLNVRPDLSHSEFIGPNVKLKRVSLILIFVKLNGITFGYIYI